MKRMLILLLTLAMAAYCVCAQGEAALPEAVAALCAQAHPGYQIAAHDGWGDERCGQFALILRQEDDNILCIAEKAVQESAYQLTVDNTNAVYDGDRLPSLMVDTMDVLFYTYADENGSSEHYHAIKKDGHWQDVDVTLYEQYTTEVHSVCSGVQDGQLYYQSYREDENGNILSRMDYAPIPIGEAFKAAMQLENFDIEQYDADPIYGLHQTCKIPGFAEPWARKGEKPVSLDLKQQQAIVLLETESGMRRLRFAQLLDDGRYLISESGPLPAGVGIDAYHSGEDELFVLLDGELLCYGFERESAGSWRMTHVQAKDGFLLVYDGVYSMESSGHKRNDRVIYGAHPWNDLFQIDFSMLPQTLEQAYEMMDQSAYALVNNPNPADRLHLRAKPDKSSASMGKFYNRTPVQVLEHGQTWTKVRIGREEAGLEGYMMTQYLAFDESEKAALKCAFPTDVLRPAFADGMLMLREPRGGAGSDAQGVFTSEPYDFIIGVVEDEWYVVMREDGSVGYILQEAFYEGNG